MQWVTLISKVCIQSKGMNSNIPKWFFVLKKMRTLETPFWNSHWDTSCFSLLEQLSNHQFLNGITSFDLPLWHHCNFSVEMLWLQVKNKLLMRRTCFRANIQQNKSKNYKSKKYRNASHSKFYWKLNNCLERLSKSFGKRINVLDQHIGMYLWVLQKCLCLHL